MEENMILHLSKSDVESVGVTMPEIIAELENAFIHAMPAYIPAIKSMGMKWVSGYPENYKKGLPYITGLIILNDTETGLPLSVMDFIWITTQRTAAATAVSAKYLARPDSETVGILGAGVQGFSNLDALKALLPINCLVR